MKFSLFSEESINQFLQRYLEAGKWDKAADMYKKLLDMHPENSNYRLRLAEMYMKSGSRKEGLEEYQRVAEDFAHMNNLDKAITIYRTILSLDASLSHIRIQLAEIYAMQGKMDEVWAQYMAAFKYLEEKKLLNQAVSVLENMSKLKIEDVKLMIQLAEMFLSRNLRPQAINQFLAIAEFMMEKKQYTEAVKYYRQVLELDTRNREAGFGLDIIKRTAPDAMMEPQPQEPAEPAAGIESEPPKPSAAPGTAVAPSAPVQTSRGQPGSVRRDSIPRQGDSIPRQPASAERQSPAVSQKPPAATVSSPEPVQPRNKPEPEPARPAVIPKPAPEPVKPAVMPKPAPQAEKREPVSLAQPVSTAPAQQMPVDLEAAVQEDLDLELLFSEDKFEILLEDIIASDCQNGAEAEDHYNLGLKYQTMSLWDAAIEEFMQAARHKDLQRKCFRSVGECYQQKGMPRHAQKYQHMALEGYLPQ